MKKKMSLDVSLFWFYMSVFIKFLYKKEMWKYWLLSENEFNMVKRIGE